MARLLRVEASTNFGAHRTGDELLVSEDAEVRALVASKLLTIVAVEIEAEPKAEPKAEPAPEAPVSAPKKPRAAKKPRDTKAKAG